MTKWIFRIVAGALISTAAVYAIWFEEPPKFDEAAYNAFWADLAR